MKQKWFYPYECMSNFEKLEEKLLSEEKLKKLGKKLMKKNMVSKKIVKKNMAMLLMFGISLKLKQPKIITTST